jgi:flagellar biosynthesis protein FliQ
MTPDYAIEMIKKMVSLVVIVAGPFLITAMVVGLMVSLFQAITSIQEQTLTFVPKALAVSGMLFLILPFSVRSLMDFTVEIFNLLPQMVR